MRKLLAIILAVALLSTMAVSAFAVDSPTATGTEETQTAGTNIVVTVEDGAVEEGKLDLTDEVAAEKGDTLTFSGLESDTPTKVSFTLENPAPTIVLRDTKTGEIVLGKLDGNTYTAIVNGDCQLEVVDNTHEYTDGPFADWAKEGITMTSVLELLVGYPNGKFNPDGTLTGAQVITALARLNAKLGGKKLVTTGEKWYEAPIAWAKEAGLTDGSDLFVPFARQQLIDVLAKFAGIEDDSTEWVVAAGLFVGNENGDLMPENNLTRAQFATVLYRYVNKIIFG